MILRKCLWGGLLLTACSVSFVSLVVLVVVWTQEGLRAAIAGLGVALLLAAGAMLLAPLLGGLVSIGNRSWDAFKVWSGAGLVAMGTNGSLGFLALALAEHL